MTPSSSPDTPPVLLTSLASAVLLDGRGDLRLLRESRGAPFDWGGVYAQLVRLTGPWTLELRSNGSGLDLEASRTQSAQEGGCWTSRHRGPEVEVRQCVAPTALPAGAVRSVRLQSFASHSVRWTVRSGLAPFLLPVLVEGIRPTGYRMERDRGGIRVTNRGFGLQLTSAPDADRVQVDGATWDGRNLDQRIGSIVLEHVLDLPAGGAADLAWGVHGGLVRDLSPAPARPADPSAVGREIGSAEDGWLAATPELAFPDAPFLEEAYRRARLGLRRLYSAPGEGLVGLVAGYPWYSALWCRDIAWMLPAVLWLGDHRWARDTLDSVLRYQCRTSIPALGGEPGELPMQIAPGPLFLYGSSDTSLYYPALTERWLRHAGDLRPLATWAASGERVLEWGWRRTDPATGLLRHGGEAQEIESATRRVGRIHYGIDSPDTTIWDSADRRDHAIDVQVLWWQSLGAARRLRTVARTSRRAPIPEDQEDRLAQTIRTRYDWPEEEYLYDSLRDGRPVAAVRPNALRAASAGLLAPDSARRVVQRAARPDLTTAWGVRTLSDRDPTYRPTSYHAGQVWTIATAWAAEAALAVNAPDLALGYLRTIAERYRLEGGWANECYRGDRAVGFNSCFLLGFSIAPFLSVLFEGLWGLALDATEPSLTLGPRFPRNWRRASLHRLRLGSGAVNLDYADGSLEVRWSGSAPLRVRWGSQVTEVRAGGSAVLRSSDPHEAS